MVFMDLYKETPLFAEMYQHIKAGAQRKLLLDSLHKQGFEEAYQILVDNNLMLKDILQITPLETCQLPINSVLQTFKELKLISEDTTFSSFEELTALIEKNDKLSKFISILKNALVNTLLKDDFKYNINDCICDLFYGNTIAQFVTNQETTDLIAITINDDYHLSDITHELIHALSFSNNLKKTPDKELVALDEICTEFLTQDLIQNIDKDLVDYTNIGEKIVRKPLNHQYEIPIQRDNCGYTRTVLAFERLLNFFKPELKKDYLCIAYKSLRTAIGEKNYEKLAYLAKTHMDTPIPYFKHSFKPINNDQEFITAFENLDENNYTDKTEYEMLKKYYKLAVKVREFCNEIIDNYLNEMNKNIGDM